jgi:hypothetical protein
MQELAVPGSEAACNIIDGLSISYVRFELFHLVGCLWVIIRRGQYLEFTARNNRKGGIWKGAVLLIGNTGITLAKWKLMKWN